MYKTSKQKSYIINEYNINGNLKSITRVSDNEKFTIGDPVIVPPYSPFDYINITSFKIIGKDSYIIDYDGVPILLNSIER